MTTQFMEPNVTSRMDHRIPTSTLVSSVLEVLFASPESNVTCVGPVSASHL
jgi:hypothetical protein